jgi:hypothetical protein
MNTDNKFSSDFKDVTDESMDKVKEALNLSKYILGVNVALVVLSLISFVTGAVWLIPIIIFGVLIIMMIHEQKVTKVISREFGFMDGIMKGAEMTIAHTTKIMEETREEAEQEKKEKEAKEQESKKEASKKK